MEALEGYTIEDTLLRVQPSDLSVDAEADVIDR